VQVSITLLKDRLEAYQLFVSYGLVNNSLLSPSSPERAEVVVYQDTRMVLMGTYVCLNVW
jgi:hypothetical protein